MIIGHVKPAYATLRTPGFPFTQQLWELRRVSATVLRWQPANSPCYFANPVDIPRTLNRWSSLRKTTPYGAVLDVIHAYRFSDTCPQPEQYTHFTSEQLDNLHVEF